jgi:hypothetical protein
MKEMTTINVKLIKFLKKMTKMGIFFEKKPLLLSAMMVIMIVRA